MRILKKATLTLAVVAMVSTSFLNSVQTSSAATWVSNLAWGNLRTVPQEGVFERYRREFDDKGVLLINSPTQHDTTWVRTDQKSVTLRYEGGVANANKSVQFLLDASTPLTDNVDDANNVATTDESGNATITLTHPGTPEEGDNVLVSIKNDVATIGPMIVVWQKPGYFPIIKLMGTPGGNQGICNDVFNCEYSDLIEKTWDWSVFKRDWLPEYSQVFVKSYTPGATIRLNYRVTDIWGQPIKNKIVNLGLDTKCSKCKWGSITEARTTNQNGEVTFTLVNKNTAKQIASNVFVNLDTKRTEGGIIAFAIVPTMNELEESADMFWPQLITTQTIKESGLNLSVKSRGGINANGFGDVVVNGVTNPALRTDPLGLGYGDQIRAKFTITYEKATDARSNILYSPTVTVTATNGGKVALVSPYHNRPYESFVDVSQMKSSLSFNYVYNLNGQQYGTDLVFAGTRAGTTTFTVAVGSSKKTFTQTFVAGPEDARFIRPVSTTNVGVPGANKKVAFEVVDRFGNGVANLPVTITSAGNGSLISPVAEMMTDSKGQVVATVKATAKGAQTLTATVTDPGGTQLSAAAVEAIGLAAGTTTSTATVSWGAVDIAAVAQKGAIKLTLLNVKGQTVTVMRGTTKLATFKATTPTVSRVIKTTKGTGNFVIKVGKTSKTVKLTVS